MDYHAIRNARGAEAKEHYNTPLDRLPVKKDLELLDVITEIADDLYYGCSLDEYTQSTDPRDIAWEKKYVYMEYPATGND